MNYSIKDFIEKIPRPSLIHIAVLYTIILIYILYNTYDIRINESLLMFLLSTFLLNYVTAFLIKKMDLCEMKSNMPDFNDSNNIVINSNNTEPVSGKGPLLLSFN
jgi:hypothetical protein